jgi:hypothetical protein
MGHILLNSTFRIDPNRVYGGVQVGYDAFGRLVDRVVRDSSADVAQRFR